MTEDPQAFAGEHRSPDGHNDHGWRSEDESASRRRHADGRSDSHFDRDDAEREARDAIGRARDELQALLENQKNAAAGQVEAIAQALRRTADELHARDQVTVASYVGHVADRIAHWSGRLRRRHVDSLAGDIRHFANQQPGLFIAGAIVVGFAAARFLKSSGTGEGSAANARTPSTHTREAAPANRAFPPAPGIPHN